MTKIPKPKISEAEVKRRRKAYQTQYYLDHREKAKEYQRLYNLEYKKKNVRFKRGSFVERRPQVQQTYHASDIMHAPAEKTLKMLTQIIAGEREYV